MTTTKLIPVPDFEGQDGGGKNEAGGGDDEDAAQRRQGHTFRVVDDRALFLHRDVPVFLCITEARSVQWACYLPLRQCV